jgi:two-component system alkaline phosphatase synthesis response regulator PhoP
MRKILIVDDDKAFNWILKQSFSNGDFSVISAFDGQEGLSIAEKEKPDLILLDILMPKMDGMEMAKNLRQNGINSKIIFLTNLKDLEHIKTRQ